MSDSPVRITVQGVLQDLENGYTRTTSDKHYQGEGKSIEEKYGLNKTQVSQLFKHDKLKGRKTKVAGTPAFILIDEEEEGSQEPIAEVETTTSEEEHTTITSETSIESITSIEEVNDSSEDEEQVTAEADYDDEPSWLG